MKELKEYITEKLKITKDNIELDTTDKDYYKLMKKLLWYARNIGHISSICNSFDEFFRDNKGLKQFCIDYINNHPDHPEMLDETTRDIVGYFRDFKSNEFDKYIEE
jgi:hypothetical protein